MLPFDTGSLRDGDTLALAAASALATLLLLWHALGLLCCTAARCRPGARSFRHLLRVAPPWVRRAAGIATLAIVCTPAIAHADAPTPASAPTADEPFVRTPAPPAAPDAPAPAPAPAPAASPAPRPASARTHVVVPGDNLWRIAADELGRVSGDARPSDAVIVPYWRAVIEQNRATLRSGDPSLIFPGEIVALPAL